MIFLYKNKLFETSISKISTTILTYLVLSKYSQLHKNIGLHTYVKSL